MLEKMGEFFDARLEGYEEHQLTAIESAEVFYPFTASLLPAAPGARVLDLGCGTGLELNWFFERNPTAAVTGIDLAEGMLGALRAKFPERNLTLICGSYFDEPFGEACYDAAVSVESLHHFTAAQKLPLYEKLCRALREDGFFILTDYFAENENREAFFQSELRRLRAEQGIAEGEFIHYDTPLTIAHEIETLRAAGFRRIETLGEWGATRTLRCSREEG